MCGQAGGHCRLREQGAICRWGSRAGLSHRPCPRPPTSTSDRPSQGGHSAQPLSRARGICHWGALQKAPLLPHFAGGLASPRGFVHLGHLGGPPAEALNLTSPRGLHLCGPSSSGLRPPTSSSSSLASCTVAAEMTLGCLSSPFSFWTTGTGSTPLAVRAQTAVNALTCAKDKAEAFCRGLPRKAQSRAGQARAGAAQQLPRV